MIIKAKFRVDPRIFLPTNLQHCIQEHQCEDSALEHALEALRGERPRNHVLEHSDMLCLQVSATPLSATRSSSTLGLRLALILVFRTAFVAVDPNLLSSCVLAPCGLELDKLCEA